MYTILANEQHKKVCLCIEHGLGFPFSRLNWVKCVSTPFRLFSCYYMTRVYNNHFCLFLLRFFLAANKKLNYLKQPNEARFLPHSDAVFFLYTALDHMSVADIK